MLLKNRKKLKDIQSYQSKIYINKDLTQLCNKLLMYVKGIPNVARVNSHNGKIFCNLSYGKTIILESAVDLFKLGVDNPDYDKLGLSKPQHAAAMIQ